MENKTGKDTLARWSRWTWPRGILALLWIALTSIVTFVMLWAADFTASVENVLGPAPSDADDLTWAALVTLGAAGVWASGPLVIFILRRKRVWLALALILFGWLALSSGLYFIRAVRA